MASTKDPTEPAAGPRSCHDGERRHVALPHTADAGIEASAPTLPALFEEAAVALGKLTAEVDPGVTASVREEIELAAEDPAGLLYGWLNELIALVDVHRGAVVEAVVERVDAPVVACRSIDWHLRGHVGLRRFGEPGVRPLRQPKSATYHRLAVRQEGDCWTMEAYLDL